MEMTSSDDELSPESICRHWKDDNTDNLITEKYLDTVWLQSIIFLSFLSNALLFAIIYLNKELQVHPMRIFMVIAFFDSLFFWLSFMQSKVCSLYFNNLLDYTITPFHMSDESLIAATEMLFKSVKSLQYLCFSATINLNFCVCIDLILMIKNPF